MPASEPPSERHGGRLLTIVFWVGVGLAPLAVLMLLIGQSGGALRLAIAFVLVAVVLIGLSITLRRDGESVRLEMEETLLEEVEMLREDVRNDIATAARATHKAFSEKLQMLHESVQALRAQVEVVRGDGVAMGPRPPHAAPVPERPALDRAGYRQPEPVAVPSGPGGGGHVGAVPPPLPQGAPGHVGGRARVPGGVVRHTETVQVTTRQTIVDQAGDDDPGRGRVYGGSVYGGNGYAGYGGEAYGSPAYAAGGVDDAGGGGRRADRYDGEPAGWAAPSPQSPPAPPAGRRMVDRSGGEPDEWSPPAGRRPVDPSGEPNEWSPSGGRRRRAEPEESWPDQRHGGDGRRPRPYDRADDEPRWTGMKAGDRWAAVRSDERGSELHIGERRAAVHASESGSEVRIEDRWAAVRREESRREPDWRAAPGYDERVTDRPGEPRRDDSGGWLQDLRGGQSEGWERRSGPAALPPGGVEPTTSWGQGWSPPEREPAGRRRRYRDDEDEYRYQPPENGGRRSWRGDEERWR